MLHEAFVYNHDMPSRVRTNAFDLVRELGLKLPDVEEGTTWGAPALEVGGHMFACLAIHKSAEPHSLVTIVGFDERDELIAADPRTYYLTEHYIDHPTVLVRLRRIDRDALRDLLIMARRFVSARATQKRPRRRPRR